MIEKKKLNTILVISGACLVVFFLVLISALNLWIKLSVDKQKSVELSVPIEKKIELTKPQTKEKKATLLELEAEKQATDIKTQQQEVGTKIKVERESPIQSDFLVN